MSIQAQAKEDRLNLIQVFEERLERVKEEDEIEAELAIERKLGIANMSSARILELETELDESKDTVRELQEKLDELRRGPHPLKSAPRPKESRLPKSRLNPKQQHQRRVYQFKQRGYLQQMLALL
ncbi:hypothetical protein BC829DRAFT_57841 [Chytridium lagenaria]|nr:hypothetical protein BC829DRAFT_57841 [Chytridium lagenaria]